MLKRTAFLALLLFLAAIELYVCAALLPYRWHGEDIVCPVCEGLLIISIFMSDILVAIGAWSFVSPEALQDYALRQNSKWFPTNPFLEWMKTANYIRFLRFLGIVVYSAGLFAAFILLKRLFETVFI